MKGGWRTMFTRLFAGGTLLIAATGTLLMAQDKPASSTAAAADAPAAPAQAATAPTPPPFETPAARRLRSGLIGSKHDFTEGGQDGRNMCLPCHTPHVTEPPVPRLDRRASFVQPLRPFRTGKVELDGWSLLCLGCHDGTTAPDVYTTAHATTVADQLGNARLGTTGLRSHPVGILYPPPSKDFNPRSVVEAAGLPLPGGRIQCGTCHDAHNTYDYAGMLKVSNERSRLCLTCHRR